MIQFLADTTSSAPQSPGALYQFTHSPFPILVLVMVILWVVMIAPKRKQDKTRQQMLDTMKRGDEVQTIGGIIGKVVEPREDRVLVKVDESSNTKIWFSRTAIARVTAEGEKAK